LASSTLPRIWCNASKAGQPDDPILSAPGRLVEIAAASEQFQKKRGGRSCSSFVRRWLRSRLALFSLSNALTGQSIVVCHGWFMQ
jgi:hypothetical protein